MSHRSAEKEQRSSKHWWAKHKGTKVDLPLPVAASTMTTPQPVASLLDVMSQMITKYSSMDSYWNNKDSNYKPFCTAVLYKQALYLSCHTYG